jgi:glycosyltransferase involved in cell wall biosynthesis
LGERKDIVECMAVMTLFCLSSKTEGFPNVVGEAMGVGIPCVVTDVGDASKLLGECGIVVPSSNSSELAKGLLKILLASERDRQIMAKCGQQRIKLIFSLSTLVQNFDRLYNELLTMEL